MVSLKEQRERQVKELIQWLREQYPKILERLREKTYWHYDQDKYQNVELTFDQMFKVDRNEAWAIMGRVVFERLRSHIQTTYLWSSKTQIDYVRTCMYAVGCKLVNRQWYCKVSLE